MIQFQQYFLKQFPVSRTKTHPLNELFQQGHGDVATERREEEPIYNACGEDQHHDAVGERPIHNASGEDQYHDAVGERPIHNVSGEDQYHVAAKKNLSPVVRGEANITKQ